jgi:hypothetical protein
VQVQGGVTPAQPSGWAQATAATIPPPATIAAPVVPAWAGAAKAPPPGVVPDPVTGHWVDPAREHLPAVVLAGWGRRCAVLCIDWLFFWVVMGVCVGGALGVLWLVDSDAYNSDTSPAPGLVMLGGALAAWIITAAVQILGTSSRALQGTVGKRVLGVKVIDDGGAPVPVAKSAGRYWL